MTQAEELLWALDMLRCRCTFEGQRLKIQPPDGVEIPEKLQKALMVDHRAVAELVTGRDRARRETLEVLRLFPGSAVMSHTWKWSTSC